MQVSIRIRGEPEELTKAKEIIRNSFDVKTESGDYPDRHGKTCRTYIEAKIKPGQLTDQAITETDLENA